MKQMCPLARLVFTLIHIQNMCNYFIVAYFRIYHVHIRNIRDRFTSNTVMTRFFKLSNSNFAGNVNTNVNLVITKAIEKGVIYHSFPKGKDLVSKTIFQEWVRRCRRGDKWNPKTSQICSEHYRVNDYERDLQHELLGSPLRRKLKKTAVPTINLPSCENQSKGDKIQSERDERIEKRHRRQEVAHIISTCTNDDDNISSDISAIPSSSQEDFEEVNVEPDRESIQQKYDQLLEKYNRLQSQYKSMNKNWRWKIRSTNDQLSYYKKKCCGLSKVKVPDEINVLKQFLTENQIALLLRTNKKVNWKDDEIAIAFTIRYYSKQCYLYLRDKLHYPLPALSSLRRWASKINLSQGILKNILILLKLAGEKMSALEKTVVIAFDEIKVKSLLEYDVAADEVVGPYNQMQVVMARSLFGKWKQPIYIGFDTKMTPSILFEIISELHKISFNVVACVSDCGGGNVGLWKNLEIDENKTFFINPQTNNNIYMFADAPHLLKLIRNWLIDQGFELENGDMINKKPLKKLFELADSEINVCNKISEKHLIVDPQKRQNVRLAAQLLSHTVGNALLRYKPGPDIKTSKNTGNFICDINKWFDIFNSYTKLGSIPTKCAYGVHLAEQNKHLDKMLHTFETMRPIGKSKNILQRFQKGLIMSIRSRGPNEHPSPLTAIARIRMITLGKNPGVLGAQTNTVDANTEEYVAASVMETANIKLNFPEKKDENIQPSTSGSSFSSSNDSKDNLNENVPETTPDALEYIAGYLAKKYKKTNPSLGDYTVNTQPSNHSYNLPTWVEQLSYGGLVKPKQAWVENITKWNKFFERFHGKFFKKGGGVVKKLTLKIAKKDKMPVEIIKSFCKLRTIIRINYNNIKSQKTNLKRKQSSDPDKSDCQRSKMRKLIKIVT
ncbi:Transposable element P transposase-like Protein [Tribolium castaneum]|uniref:Transposable element P transposase-like Protein n=1 Tax=Tribolium castaneum TaxID=7070 RepID=D7EKZ5_TRICA|nr:Transposable element P transposase-like Protein [Tribolium castaneum]